MTNHPTAVNEHIEKLSGPAKEWVSVFVDFMRRHYPTLEEVVSFQMPTYKLGRGAMRNYIAFGTGQAHLSLHTTDFEYIAALKTKLKNGGKGKGCVHVQFSNKEEMHILFEAIKDICDRSAHQS